MKFESQINLNQFIKLTYILYYKKALVICLTIAGLIMLITSLLFYAGIASTIYKDNPPTYQLTLGLFFVFGFPVIIYFSTMKNFAASQRLHEKIEYDFNYENLKMTGNSFKTEFTWEKSYKIEELSQWFLIYQNKRAVNLIPKYNMTTEQIIYLKDIFRKLRQPEVKLKK